MASSSSPKVTPDPNPIDLKGLLEGPPAPIVVTTTTKTTTIDQQDTENEKKIEKIPSTTAKLLVDCRCQLGECCLWDEREETVVFISILDKAFHKLKISASSSNNKLQTYQTAKMIGAVALLDYEDEDEKEESTSEDGSGPGYLVAWEDGFQLYDIEGDKALSGMSHGEAVDSHPGGKDGDAEQLRSRLPGHGRLNDGRVDPTGTRFICGCCCSSTSPGPLKVYKCEYDSKDVDDVDVAVGDTEDADNEHQHALTHTPIVDEIRVTNSICWSLDGTTMYLADSPTQQIYKHDYDLQRGTLSKPTLLHTKPTGNPDGSVVDAQGFLWNATWREGQGQGFVDRIDPTTGQTVFRVHLPDNTSEASCCCFGGPNLDILFITSAWENLDPTTEPNAGGLYAVKLPPDMKGRTEQRFKVRRRGRKSTG